MTRPLPTEWHPQDWLLIAEALIEFAGPHYDGEEPGRHERAWFLVEAIADYHSMSLVEIVDQIDDEWPYEVEHLE